MFRKAITANTRVLTASYTRSVHATPDPGASTVTEKVSEMADKVNKKVGRGLASAIETGERAAEKTKETLGTAGHKAEEKTEQAKQFTRETAEQAKAETKTKR